MRKDLKKNVALFRHAKKITQTSTLTLILVRVLGFSPAPTINHRIYPAIQTLAVVCIPRKSCRFPHAYDRNAR